MKPAQPWPGPAAVQLRGLQSPLFPVPRGLALSGWTPASLWQLWFSLFAYFGKWGGEVFWERQCLSGVCTRVQSPAVLGHLPRAPGQPCSHWGIVGRLGLCQLHIPSGSSSGVGWVCSVCHLPGSPSCHFSVPYLLLCLPCHRLTKQGLRHCMLLSTGVILMIIPS